MAVGVFHPYLRHRGITKLQVPALGCQHQLAVLHPPQAQDPIGKMAYLGTSAPHDDHFQAVVMIQVDVQRGNDRMMMVVLDAGQPFLQMLLWRVDCGTQRCIYLILPNMTSCQ